MAISLAQIAEFEALKAIRYSIGLAKVRACDSFQDDAGETVHFAKIEMGASVVTIMMDAADAAKVKPYIGKHVTLAGTIETELKKTGLKVQFLVGNIQEIK